MSDFRNDSILLFDFLPLQFARRILHNLEIDFVSFTRFLFQCTIICVCTREWRGKYSLNVAWRFARIFRRVSNVSKREFRANLSIERASQCFLPIRQRKKNYGPLDFQILDLEERGKEARRVSVRLRNAVEIKARVLEGKKERDRNRDRDKERERKGGRREDGLRRKFPRRPDKISGELADFRAAEKDPLKIPGFPRVYPGGGSLIIQRINFHAPPGHSASLIRARFISDIIPTMAPIHYLSGIYEILIHERNFFFLFSIGVTIGGARLADGRRIIKRTRCEFIFTSALLRPYAE